MKSCCLSPRCLKESPYAKVLNGGCGKIPGGAPYIVLSARSIARCSHPPISTSIQVRSILPPVLLHHSFLLFSSLHLHPREGLKKNLLTSFRILSFIF